MAGTPANDRYTTARAQQALSRYRHPITRYTEVSTGGELYEHLSLVSAFSDYFAGFFGEQGDHLSRALKGVPTVTTGVATTGDGVRIRRQLRRLADACERDMHMIAARERKMWALYVGGYGEPGARVRRRGFDPTK